MEKFTFHNPTQVIFGKGTVSEIGEAIRQRGYKKVLLLAGGGSIQKNGVYTAVAESTRKAGVECIEVWGIRVNPVLSKVREAIGIAKREKVEAILAVGGGSVVDSGKAVAAGCCVEDVWATFEAKSAVNEALPLFTVLTLSATGTEMNEFAVITNEDEKKKWAIGGPGLFPAVSIVDPTVQFSLPWVQTAYGAIDALSHIMEFHFIGKTEETTIALNESVMRTIIKVTDRLQEEPNDYDARASLAWATTLALNGLSGVGLQGGDWSTHMLEHAVSAEHPEVVHAGGLAVLFPAWILHLQASNPVGFRRWAKEVWDGVSVEDAVTKMRQKYEQWGVPTTLSGLGIEEGEFATIVDNVSREGTMGALKELTREDLLAILKRAA